MVVKGRVQHDVWSPEKIKWLKVMLSLLNSIFAGSVEQLNWDQYDCKAICFS